MATIIVRHGKWGCTALISVLALEARAMPIQTRMEFAYSQAITITSSSPKSCGSGVFWLIPGVARTSLLLTREWRSGSIPASCVNGHGLDSSRDRPLFLLFAYFQLLYKTTVPIYLRPPGSRHTSAYRNPGGRPLLVIAGWEYAGSPITDSWRLRDKHSTRA